MRFLRYVFLFPMRLRILVAFLLVAAKDIRVSGGYNAFAHEYLFPIQPIESAVALGIGFSVANRVKKNHFEIDGKEYPIMMLLFGSTRFVCEFFRANEKIWLGCSSLSLHALFMCIVGLIWLMILNRKSKIEAD